tara:strand:+ start:664 stop:855 length:192 start_codon:yes stop_codon:yes gene_type:complete
MFERLMRRNEVEATTALSRAAIYAKMADGSFPKPVRIGKRAVAWRQSDIAAWIEQCAADSAAS